MVEQRTPSWNASGLVEKAWKRLSPPTQEELRRRLNLSARTNLSKLNNGTMAMTLAYAERIVEAVREDDPSFTVDDLGAPLRTSASSSLSALERLEALERGLVDRLEALEEKVERYAANAAEDRSISIRLRHEIVEALERLELVVVAQGEGLAPAIDQMNQGK